MGTKNDEQNMKKSWGKNYFLPKYIPLTYYIQKLGNMGRKAMEMHLRDLDSQKSSRVVHPPPSKSRPTAATQC